MIKGVDISKYQAGYEIEKGIDFIIVKGSEGRRATTESVAQLKMARASGLVVGAYHWLHKGNIKAQAKFFVDHVKPRAGEFLVCDWENNEPGGNPNASRAEMIEFIKEVKRLAPQCKVGLYCNADWWRTRAAGYCGDFLWIAHYGVSQPGIPEDDWLLWQYGAPDYDKKYKTDVNRAKFNSRASMVAWARGNAEPAPAPAYDPPPLRERISWRRTPGGNPVRACTCMIENIEKVVEPRLKAAGIIKYSVDIWQGAYSGSSKSAGTHTGGGAVDVAQYSDAAVKIWRTSGWDFWRRGRDYGFDPHGHGILRGCPHLSSAAEDQHDDYRRGRNALYDHARDPHDEIGQPMITWREAIEKYAPDRPVAGGGGGAATYDSDIEEFLMTADWDPIVTTKPQRLKKLGAWQYLTVTDKGNISFAEGPVRVMGYLSLIIHGKPGESVYFRTVEDERGSKDEWRRRATYSDHCEVTITPGSTYAKVPLAYNAGGPRKGWAHNYVRLQWHSSDPNCTITRAEVRVYEGKAK